MVGLDFDVIPSAFDERAANAATPAELVEKLSFGKCSDIAEKLDPGHIVIGSDTIVVLDGDILEKPADKEEAFTMIKRLTGNTHTVFTGVTIIETTTGKTVTFHEETSVTMYDFDDEDIRAYIETGDPMDKAGAYGVQGRGAFLVKEIRGDYFTVVGLPVAHLLKELKKF